MEILRNRREIVVHGHFDNVATFRDEFVVGLMNALESITNSNDGVDVTEFEFEIMVVKIYQNLGGTKITTIARKAIGNGDAGLYTEPSGKNGTELVPKNCCGWVALLRALIHNPAVRGNWTGSLDWLTWDDKDPRETFRKKRLMKRLIIQLKSHLGIDEDIWNLQPANGLSTQAKVIAVQPKLLIVIMDQNNKLRLFRECGP